MKKEIKKKQVFAASRSVSMWKDSSYTWGDVKKEFAHKKFELLDSDRLTISFDEGFDEPDNSREASYDIFVYRDVEETDEELAKRVASFEKHKERQDKKDYETYLRLKNRFDLKTNEKV